jgi:hypothetical protein
VEESHLDLATTRKKLALYASPQGVSFRYPDIRTSVHTFNGVTTGTSYSQILQSHVGYNSAYLIYFRSTSKAGAAEYTLVSPTDISIVDDANNRLTMDRMDSSYMQRQLFKQTDFAGQSTAEDIGFQVVPFCLSLSKLIHSGHATGGIVENGRTKLTFTCSAAMAALTNVELVVHSVMYSMMDIRRDRITFHKS